MLNRGLLKYLDVVEALKYAWDGAGWIDVQDDSSGVGLYCILLRDRVCRLDCLLRASWSQEGSEQQSMQG